jgi:hypothetical protein
MRLDIPKMAETARVPLNENNRRPDTQYLLRIETALSEKLNEPPSAVL